MYVYIYIYVYIYREREISLKSPKKYDSARSSSKAEPCRYNNNTNINMMNTNTS